MYYTIIIYFPERKNHKYHVAYTDDPVNYLRNKSHRGYFAGNHSRKGQIVFATKGNFKQKIHSFGTKRFMEFIRGYNSVEHLKFKFLS